jgi:hypothetical protein
MNVESLKNLGIVAESPELQNVLNVLLHRHKKGDEKITPDYVKNYLQMRRSQIEEKRAERLKELAEMEASKIKPRPANSRDLNKSRGAVQTRYRRSTLGRLDPTAKADKDSPLREKGSCKAKASKEKKYNVGGESTGWNTSSQGAGNVVGARSVRFNVDFGDRESRSLGVRSYK